MSEDCLGHRATKAATHNLCDGQDNYEYSCAAPSLLVAKVTNIMCNVYVKIADTVLVKRNTKSNSHSAENKAQLKNMKSMANTQTLATPGTVLAATLSLADLA